MTDEIPNANGFYASGWHKKWEVYLHRLRRAAREKNKCLSTQEELQLLHRWTVKHWKTADEFSPCSECIDEIARAELQGVDPFLPPATIKTAIGAMCTNRSVKQWAMQ